MHGLINRSIQGFLRDTYGAAVWARVAREARLGFDSFEPMLTYPPDLTPAVLNAASKVLCRPLEGVLEDLGTYLVSHPNTEGVRRLLRFGGVTYDDFLHSLEDLPERARLALPDLDLPGLELTETNYAEYRLAVSATLPGMGQVLVGLLRAMADDYGALVLLDWESRRAGQESIVIRLLDHRHSSGREFDLGGWLPS
ncbi:MAG: heme NO-binding protein [Pseudorhodobacter sp.]|nr:MAG: heme NO-binding protein [Pseudorhodobacter sp.]